MYFGQTCPYSIALIVYSLAFVLYVIRLDPIHDTFEPFSHGLPSFLHWTLVQYRIFFKGLTFVLSDYSCHLHAMAHMLEF